MKAPLPKILLSILVVGSVGIVTEVATERLRKDIPLQCPQDKNKPLIANKWQCFLSPISGNFWTLTEAPKIGIRALDPNWFLNSRNCGGCYFSGPSPCEKKPLFWPWGSKMDHVRILWFNAVRFRD